MLTFLHPHGPSSYPGTQDILINNILTLVDPRTRTGRVYTLSKKETTTASERFRVLTAELTPPLLCIDIVLFKLSLTKNHNRGEIRSEKALYTGMYQNINLHTIFRSTF